MSSTAQPANISQASEEDININSADLAEPDVATVESTSEIINNIIVPAADDRNRISTQLQSQEGLIAPTVSTLIKQMQNDLTRFLHEKLAALEPTPQTKPESVCCFITIFFC